MRPGAQSRPGARRIVEKIGLIPLIQFRHFVAMDSPIAEA
jgi:hypothetical protein